MLIKGHWEESRHLTWDRMKLVILENLSGMAQEWAYTLLSDFRDMADFEGKFNDMFLEATRGKSHVPELWNRKKEARESMREFISAINIGITKTREPVGDSYKKRILYEGLPRVLKEQAADALVRPDVDYTKFCQKLIRLEDKEKTLRDPLQSQSSIGSPPFSEQHGYRNALDKTELTERREYTLPEHGSPEKRDDRKREERSRFSVNGARCYQCGDRGHRSSSCTVSRQTEAGKRALERDRQSRKERAAKADFDENSQSSQDEQSKENEVRIAKLSIRKMKIRKPLHTLLNMEEASRPNTENSVMNCKVRKGTEFRDKVSIDGIKFTAIFDTGCQRLVIHPRVITKLQSTGVIKTVFPLKLKATLADGSAGQVLGTTWVRCEYKGFTLVCIAVIMNTGDHNEPDVLIGNQVMAPAAMSFDWTLMKVTPKIRGEFFQEGTFRQLYNNRFQAGDINANTVHYVAADAPIPQVSSFNVKGCRFTTTKGSEETAVTEAGPFEPQNIRAARLAMGHPEDHDTPSPKSTQRMGMKIKTQRVTLSSLATATVRKPKGSLKAVIEKKSKNTNPAVAADAGPSLSFPPSASVTAEATAAGPNSRPESVPQSQVTFKATLSGSKLTDSKKLKFTAKGTDASVSILSSSGAKGMNTALGNKARMQSTTAQHDVSERYNETRRKRTFGKDDPVVVQQRKVSGKLSLQYAGPYTVINRFDDDYVVSSITTPTKTKTSHVSNLKPYTEFAEIWGNRSHKRISANDDHTHSLILHQHLIT